MYGQLQEEYCNQERRHWGCAPSKLHRVRVRGVSGFLCCHSCASRSVSLAPNPYCKAPRTPPCQQPTTERHQHLQPYQNICTGSLHNTFMIIPERCWQSRFSQQASSYRLDLRRQSFRMAEILGLRRRHLSWPFSLLERLSLIL